MGTISREDVEKLKDVDLERSFLKGLMVYSTNAISQEALFRSREKDFSAPERVSILNAVVALTDKRVVPTLESVGIQIQGLGLDAEFIEILKVEETPNFIFVLQGLQSLAKARRAYEHVFNSAKALLEKKPVNATLQELVTYVDEELSDNTEGLKTYKQIKEHVQNLPPVTLYSTGIKGLDPHIMLQRGMFGLLLADPEMGKSLFLNQMAEEFARKDINSKAIIFPFEFSSENYVRQKIEQGADGYFDHEKLFIDDGAVELSELRIKILQAKREGAIFIGIDSQMSLQNSGHTGREESLESKKFEMLSNLAIQYDLIIFLIAQQKLDAKLGTVYGSAKGAYLPKVIFHLGWEDKEKTKRIIQTIKNKVTHKKIKLELEIVPKTAKFKVVQSNMVGVVGGASKNQSCETFDYQEDKGADGFEVLFEDENGNSLPNLGSLDFPHDQY